MDAEQLTGSLKKLVMWYKVKELKSKGLNKAQIARCLGINRNTVRKYQSMSESEFTNRQSYRRNYNHKLDSYEDFVHKSLESHPYLSSSQIRDWLREQYEDFPDVGQKTVYNYVQYIRRKYHMCYNNRFTTLAYWIFTLVGTGGPAPWRWPFPDR